LKLLGGPHICKKIVLVPAPKQTKEKAIMLNDFEDWKALLDREAITYTTFTRTISESNVHQFIVISLLLDQMVIRFKNFGFEEFYSVGKDINLNPEVENLE
jgi:hypothetical protein